MKYAVLIKHFGRDMWDVRVEIVNAPSHVGPKEVEDFIKEGLLGPFEVIAVTDRINEQRFSALAPDQERVE